MLKSPNGTKYYLSGNVSHLTADAGVETLTLFVHGIGSCSDLFEDIVTDLEARGHTVLTFDLLGRGRSNFPDDNKFDGPAHIQQIHDLLEYINKDKISLNYNFICHSMGGAIGALYICTYPENVKSLVLLAPAGLMDPGPIKLLRGSPACMKSFMKNRVLLPSQEKAWRADFVRKTDYGKEMEERTVTVLRGIKTENPRVFEGFYQSVLQFPLYGLESTAKHLALLPIGIMLLWGTADKAVPYKPNFERWKKVIEMRESAPNSTNIAERVIKTYPDFGHGFYIEVGEEIRIDIVNFLS